MVLSVVRVMAIVGAHGGASHGGADLRHAEEHLDAVGTREAATAAQRAPLPPTNPWPASPASTPVGPTLADSAPFAFESTRMAPRLHYYLWRVGEK